MDPDLTVLLLRKSVGSMTSERAQCSVCHRTPLTGELLHVFESDRVLCQLCLSRLPEDRRKPLRSERVHASERHLAVVPHAA